METTSTIALILVILFLSFIGLIALALFGGTAASVASNVYAELSKTPDPVPSISPTAMADSRISNPAPSYTIPTPTPDTSYADPSTVSVPELTIPDVSAYPTPSTPITSSSRATVISENANLRADPVVTGEVISVVPQGSSVEIIRQKGPWFFVSVGSDTGWLHGNTIELDFEF
ncbi:MAG: SH3 domain-containing protein [Pyrinomonadaceae bacterium]